MKKGELKVGFKSLERKLKKSRGGIKAILDCNNCISMYADRKGEEEEYCHNNSVTPYDMTKENNKTYCSFFMPPWEKENRGDY